ncbi:extracellular solute-binding protein [Siccirubricoccus sp. KC 17139]|uniref:Extracellular solute-binding protein n=1 Tax=Siccirubricoccus soli TaxID=2899147 RepID=A0ABT1CZK7_9PROT|nr:extracellular solute-binding protein [Siccirubricoccus soli]MCO6415093.1 extracellular solute-binding protein [Siccirubricoccus soli]MCP2681224.1 extracellular solute-binding protein [Siccirubricoccus soli]
MDGMSRRRALQASLGATALLAAPARAQPRPEKLVYIGENQGGWKRTLMEEVAPAFEHETGIRVEFTMLPVDAWRARLKAELGAGSTGIDIAQWSVGMAGWMAPHLLDHEQVVAKIAQRDRDFAWDDFLAGSKRAATYDGKLVGIPYRITTGILHYQKALLAQAGFAQAPQTFAEFERVALAVNAPPERYAFGIMGKQGSGSYTSLASWLYSAGAQLVDFKTGEVFINQPKAVEALQFYADLMVKHKVVPPEVTTWEYDEIIAGGQRDRYVMTQTFAPYGTLINDPANSRTAGRWAWDTVPGHTAKDQSRTWIDGHFLAVPRYTRNADWAIEFIRMATSQQWHLRSMERGNAPPRGSVLRDSDMVAKLGWPPVAAAAIETGFPTPAHPAWDTLELALRSGISETLQGQKSAKQALDAVAADWQRSLRRAGIRRG